MRKHGALMIEIIFAVLFFALSAMFLTEIFSVAWLESHRATVLTEALSDAQNVAERLNGVDDISSEMTEMGFQDGFLDRENYTLAVKVSETNGLVTGSVYAIYRGETILTLPFAHYVPKEARE